MPEVSVGRGRLLRALGSTWRRTSRRALVIGAAVVVAGPATYIALPASSMANPGTVATATTAPSAAAVPTPVQVPALLAGMIENDVTIEDPIGVVTSPPDLAIVVDTGLIGWPVTDHTPSTGFGYRSDPFTHRQRWHDGVDLGQPCGDPARASLDGTVAYAGWAGGYGNRIILRHADRAGRSFATTYNHLSRFDVAVGDVVNQGDVIARIGSTGRSTACHMHFEVILGGSYVDPMRFLTGDQSKASLSRRVGSYMPSGMPSPGPVWDDTPTTTPTPKKRTPSATGTSSPTPNKPTPTPTSTTSPGTPTPSPGTPTPTAGTPTPTVGTPTPTAGTPTPTAGTPTPTTETPSPSTSPPSAGTPTSTATPSPSTEPPSPSTTPETEAPEPSTPTAAPSSTGPRPSEPEPEKPDPPKSEPAKTTRPEPSPTASEESSDDDEPASAESTQEDEGQA